MNISEPSQAFTPAKPSTTPVASESASPVLPMPVSGNGSMFWRIIRIPEVGVLIPLAALILFFFIRDPSFLSTGNMSAMAKGIAVFGIVAVGQTLLLIVGELDLSVGSVAALCAVITGWLMTQGHVPVPLAILIGILAGAACGVFNALLAVRFGIPAFITTLSMFYVARGFAYLISKGYPISPGSAAIKEFGRAQPLGVTWGVIVFVIIAFIGDLVLRKTTFGRAVYATGGNREVANLVGIRTSLIRSTCYAVTGALSAIAGIIVMCELNSAEPTTGTGMELDVIASVVIGGVSLFGGAGTVFGTALGLIMMQVVRSGLVAEEVSSHWQTVAVGWIMAAAVGIDTWRRNSKIQG